MNKRFLVSFESQTKPIEFESHVPVTEPLLTEVCYFVPFSYPLILCI